MKNRAYHATQIVKQLLIIGFYGIPFVFLVVLIMLPTKQSIPTHQVAESTYNGLTTVSATHLSKESEKNAVAATRNYGENKMLIVTGKVVSVGMFGGHPIVELEGAKDFGSRNVKCIYPKNRINTVTSLSKGQTVAVIGTCEFDYGIIELTVKP